MTDEKRAEWLKLIEGLQGTCGDLSEEHTELWNDAEFCLLVDQEIFRCEVCSWWCEMSEMAGDYVCDDCEEDGEEE